MKITFKSNKLEKSLTVPKEISRTYGNMAQKVNQRMKEFFSFKKPCCPENFT